MGQKSERTVALALTWRLSAAAGSVREGCPRRVFGAIAWPRRGISSSSGHPNGKN